METKEILNIKELTNKPPKATLSDESVIDNINNRYKKKDVIFSLKNESNTKYSEWAMYNDFNGDDVYQLLKKSESMNFKLKINKFSNFMLENEYQNCRIFEKNIISSVNNEYNELLTNTDGNYDYITFDAKLIDKLAIGIGGHSVYNFDFCLHHTYGIPYIPGQTVKGVFKNHLMKKYDLLDLSDIDKDYIEKEQKLKKLGAINSIFGKEDHIGNIIFFDVYPINDYKYHRDIITPHYKDRKYRDDNDIDPMKFMTVIDTTFRFNILVEKSISNIKNELSSEKTMYEFIIKELVETLKFKGLGAKTSVGYGYFDINYESVIKSVEKKRKEKEEYLEKLQYEKTIADMSEFDRKIYEISLKESFQEQFKNLKDYFACEINNLSHEEGKNLASRLKECYIKNGDWKYKPGKKQNKNNEKIKKICDILEIDLPTK